MHDSKRKLHIENDISRAMLSHQYSPIQIRAQIAEESITVQN
ncbi:hypothetical protein DSUL_20275 [Desulfovibrionales bacterium]